MKTTQRDIFGQSAFFPLVFLVSFTVYLLFQYSAFQGIPNPPRVLDNDDAMRLVSVRDFLNGQGWFDTTQYRLVPPEGVSLHWSRLIDAPIAALNLFFRLFKSPQAAAALAAAAWPVILFAVYLTLVGRVTRAAFGNSAACFAMIAAGTMPMLNSNFFPFGRVDHHGVQIILMLSICGNLIAPGRHVIFGGVAGLMAALSLAVGLETIVFIMVAGVILALQFTFRVSGAGDRLLAFGLALGLAAPAIFIIQTSPAVWGVMMCDQLGVPVLALTTSGAVFAGLATLVCRYLLATAARFAAVSILAVVCALAVIPFIDHCFGGPYAELPDYVREVVIGGIIEAMPVYHLLQVAPVMALSILLPLYLVWLWTGLAIVSGSKISDKGLGRMDISILFAFLSLGVLASFWQVRAFTWGLSVLPVAFGVVFAGAVNLRWRFNGLLKPLILIPAAVVILLPQTVIWPVAASLSVPPKREQQQVSWQDALGGSCNEYEALAGLNGLEPSLILVPLNLGPRVLLYTHHSVTSAPNHRSMAALKNGVVPYFGDAEDMASTVQEFGVNLVLICDGQDYGRPDSMGSRLLSDDLPSWLAPIDINTAPVLVMQVLRNEAGELN